MADTNIALKLTLDAIGAKEEATGLAKAVDKFGQGFERMGAQMENTMRGRLIKGVIGSFRDNFEDLMKDDVPAIIREAGLEIQIAAAAGGAISQQAGQLAGAFAKQAVQANLPSIQEGFASFSLLTQNGRTPFKSPEQEAAVINKLIDRSLAEQQLRINNAAAYEAVVRQRHPSGLVTGKTAGEAVERAVTNVGGAAIRISQFGQLLGKMDELIDLTRGE